MEKEFIPYEQALALKELGFDEPCLGYFDPLYKKLVIWEKESTNSSSNWVSAPTFSQAFSFFREKYGCEFHIICRRHTSIKYYEVFLFDGNNSSMVFGKSLKYEQAELELLNKLIEIALKK